MHYNGTKPATWIFEDGQNTIALQLKCNGNPDCPDNSDESPGFAQCQCNRTIGLILIIFCVNGLFM